MPDKGTNWQMQDKVNALERELEWVRGELKDEKAALDGAVEKERAKLRDTEAALTKLKNTKRDELKNAQKQAANANKERTALTDRIRELEGNIQKAIDQVGCSVDKAFFDL